MKDSKDRVNHFYDFGVTCSYDEISKSLLLFLLQHIFLLSILRCFKQLQIILMQTPILKMERYLCISLALLLTQSQIKCDPQEEMDQTIIRIKKTDMSTSIPYKLRIHEYRRHKKSPMLTGSTDKIILPLKVMAHTVIAKQRAMHNNFEFFQGCHF